MHGLQIYKVASHLVTETYMWVHKLIDHQAKGANCAREWNILPTETQILDRFGVYNWNQLPITTIASAGHPGKSLCLLLLVPLSIEENPDFICTPSNTWIRIWCHQWPVSRFRDMSRHPGTPHGRPSVRAPASAHPNWTMASALKIPG